VASGRVEEAIWTRARKARRGGANRATGWWREGGRRRRRRGGAGSSQQDAPDLEQAVEGREQQKEEDPAWRGERGARAAGARSGGEGRARCRTSGSHSLRAWNARPAGASD
jgi:hypothetical protein